MTRGRVTFGIAVLCASSAACSLPTGSDDDEGLDVEVRDTALELTNYTDAAVYTLLLARPTPHIYDVILCKEPEVCPGIEPGDTRMVAFTDVLGWTEIAEEVRVSWWHLIEDGEGGYSIDSLSTVVVPVK